MVSGPPQTVRGPTSKPGKAQAGAMQMGIVGQLLHAKRR